MEANARHESLRQLRLAYLDSVQRGRKVDIDIPEHRRAKAKIAQFRAGEILPPAKSNVGKPEAVGPRPRGAAPRP